MKEYKPYGFKGKYIKVYQGENSFFLCVQKKCIKFPTLQDWGLPRAGLALMHGITSDNVVGKDICEIGGGYYAFCAGACFLLGASTACSIEAYKPAADWVKQIYNNIPQFTSVWGDTLRAVDKQFDFIIGNLPQLPQPPFDMDIDERTFLYQFGGVDGWQVIQQYIDEAFGYLRCGGKLRLAVADFHKPNLNRIKHLVKSTYTIPFGTLMENKNYREYFKTVFPNYEIGQTQTFLIVDISHESSSN